MKEESLRQINEHTPWCPYCELEFEGEDLWSTFGENDWDQKEIECTSCGKKCLIEQRIVYNVSASCEVNKVDHNWHSYDFLNKKGQTDDEGKTWRYCPTCGEMQRMRDDNIQKEFLGSNPPHYDGYGV